MGLSTLSMKKTFFFKFFSTEGIQDIVLKFHMFIYSHFKKSTNFFCIYTFVFFGHEFKKDIKK